MTRQERKNPDILKASRKKRIAAGAGQNVEQVNKLLKMHRNMADMMKAMGSGKRGPLAGIAQAMGFGGGMKPPSPEEMKALQEKMQSGGGQGLPSLPKDLPAGLRTGLPNVPGLAGLAQGAQPSDRVSRFLDAAGVKKREVRNNPEKAVPRKERKAQAEAAAKG